MATIGYTEETLCPFGINIWGEEIVNYFEFKNRSETLVFEAVGSRSSILLQIWVKQD
jgi:hypothetical protein